MAAGEAGALFVRVGADISGFSKGMAAAQAQMNGVASRMQGMGTRMTSVGKSMTKFVSLPIAAGFGLAIKAAANFEQELNIMQATSGATGAQMGKVSKLAKALGADIRIPGASAADAAQSMTELAKGGLSVNESMKAARGTLTLAAAAQIGNAEAATITADALNAFGLKGKDAGKVADLLAASANASTAEITDMALSLQQSSAVAKMAGVSIEDTVTALARLANAGIKGSDAGTSLKTMLMRLQAPIGSGAKAIREYNIQLRDQSGNLKSLPALASEFGSKLGGLSKAQRDHAMAAIFGSDAIRAGNILLMQGAEAHENMREKVTKQGAAAEFAAARMKGFKGSLEAFKSSVETLAISLGQMLLPMATRVMGAFSGLAGAIDGLPGPVKQMGMGIAGIAMVAGPAVFGLGKLMKTIQGVKDGSSALGAGLMALRGPWGLAAAGASILGFAIYKMFNQGKRVDVFAREMSGAFKRTADASRAAADAIDRQKDALLRLQGISIDARDTALQLRDAKARLAATEREGGKATDAYKRALIDVERLELEVTRSTRERNKTLREGILDVKAGSDATDASVKSAARARDMAQRQTFAIRAGIATGTEAERITKNFGRAQSDLSTTLKAAVQKHLDAAAGARDLAAGITGADSASQSFKRNYEKLAKLEALKASIAAAFWNVSNAAGAASSAVDRLYARLSKPPPKPNLNPFSGQRAQERVLDPKQLAAAIRAASATIAGQKAALARAFAGLGNAAMKAFDDQTAQHVARIGKKFAASFAKIDEFQGALTPAEAEIKALEGARDAARLVQSIADAERDLAKAQSEGDPQAILAAQQSLDDARLEQRLASLRTQAETERAERDKNAAAQRAELQSQQDDELRIYEATRDIERQSLENHFAALKAKFARGKTMTAAAQEELVALLNSYGIEFKKSGMRLGDMFGKGLEDSVTGVSSVAEKLAKAIAKYLKLRSPADKGPLSSLDTWLSGFAPTLLSGLDMGAISDAVTIDGGSFRGRAAASSVVNITVTGNTMLGSEREVARRLADLIAPETGRRITLATG